MKHVHQGDRLIAYAHGAGALGADPDDAPLSFLIQYGTEIGAQSYVSGEFLKVPAAIADRSHERVVIQEEVLGIHLLRVEISRPGARHLVYAPGRSESIDIPTQARVLGHSSATAIHLTAARTDDPPYALFRLGSGRTVGDNVAHLRGMTTRRCLAGSSGCRLE